MCRPHVSLPLSLPSLTSPRLCLFAPLRSSQSRSVTSLVGPPYIIGLKWSRRDRILVGHKTNLDENNQESSR